MNFWYEIKSCHLFSRSFHFDPLFFIAIYFPVPFILILYFSSQPFYQKQKQLDTNLSWKEFNYAKKKKKKLKIKLKFFKKL